MTKQGPIMELFDLLEAQDRLEVRISKARAKVAKLIAAKAKTDEQAEAAKEKARERLRSTIRAEGDQMKHRDVFSVECLKRPTAGGFSAFEVSRDGEAVFRTSGDIPALRVTVGRELSKWIDAISSDKAGDR